MCNLEPAQSKRRERSNEAPPWRTVREEPTGGFSCSGRQRARTLNRPPSRCTGCASSTYQLMGLFHQSERVAIYVCKPRCEIMRFHLCCALKPQVRNECCSIVLVVSSVCIDSKRCLLVIGKTSWLTGKLLRCLPPFVWVRLRRSGETVDTYQIKPRAYGAPGEEARLRCWFPRASACVYTSLHMWCLY